MTVIVGNVTGSDALAHGVSVSDVGVGAGALTDALAHVVSITDAATWVVTVSDVGIGAGSASDSDVIPIPVELETLLEIWQFEDESIVEFG